MPNKYEKVAEAGKIIPNIFANISAGIEAGKKPADKAIEGCNQGSILKIVSEGIHIANSSSDGYIDKIKKDNATLKKSLSKAGELIEELKRENKLQKAQLRRFGQVFDNCGGKEVDAEFNDKEFNDYVNKKKGA